MQITNNIGISFEINQKDHTAITTSSPKAKNGILIPRSISFKNQEFIITNIGQNSFKRNKHIKSVILPEDSLIYSICKGAFSYSSIEKLSISHKLTQIEDSAFEWCQNLHEIDIPDNSSLCHIGKNSFSHTSLETFSIPYRLTEICEFSFSYCERLKMIEIPTNSFLRSIQKYAFSCSSLEFLSIPKNLEKLEEGWCAGTSKLTRFSVSKENKIYSSIDNDFIVGKSDQNRTEFDRLVFARRNIEEVKIPMNIKHIESYCFSCCNNLKSIEFDPKISLFTIDKESFSFSTLEHISIPNEVTEINEAAFSYCKNLMTVNISENSMLSSIKKEVFSSSAIEEIYIPSKITEIKEGTFSYCENLKVINISEKSSLESICKDAFSHSSLETIFIPKSVKKLEEGWCAGTDKLINFSVSKENKIYSSIDDNFIVGKSDQKGKDFDRLVFARRNIEEVKIPINIKHIESYCFSCCNNLKSIEFDPKNSLSTIDKESFSFSTLEHISIPNEVTEINEAAFLHCDKLRSILFYEKSLLKCIDKDVFANSGLESISIPSSITEIKEHAFFNCVNLKRINIPHNSLLSKINKEAFTGCSIETISFPSNFIGLLSGLIKHHKISNIEIIDENVHINSSFQLPCISSISFPNAKEIIVDKKCGKFTLFVLRDCNLIGDESSLKQHEVKFISPKKLMKIETIEVELIENLLQNNEPFGSGLISQVFKVKLEINNIRPKKKKIKKTKKSKETKKAKTSSKEIRVLKLFTKNSSNNNLDNDIDEFNQIDPDKMKRYISQYEILNSLNHRNIIKVFGFFCGDETHLACILEEYFKLNLENSIKKLKEIDLVSIIYEICTALKEVHQKGIIHRDLKPTNILVDTENHTKICDFNISELISIETQVEFEIKLNGNKYSKFLAPEILNKEEKINEKVDVYSFGVMMFYILTKGENLSSGIDDLLTGKKATIPMINKTSFSLIEKCLSLSPNERPSFIQIEDFIVKNQFGLIDGIENEIGTIKKHLGL